MIFKKCVPWVMLVSPACPSDLVAPPLQCFLLLPRIAMATFLAWRSFSGIQVLLLVKFIAAEVEPHYFVHLKRSHS